jgi:hypothetical protein
MLVKGNNRFINTFKNIKTMTDFKRRTLTLSTGKRIKLFGNSMAIGRSLEIGDGGAPNIFSCFEESQEELGGIEDAETIEDLNKRKVKRSKKSAAVVLNPHKLTKEEMLEVADFNIRLWMELKDNVREYGIEDPRVFKVDTAKY